jgi:hypothetical protein
MYPPPSVSVNHVPLILFTLAQGRIFQLQQIIMLITCITYLYFQQLPVFDIMQTTPFPLQTGQ